MSRLLLVSSDCHAGLPPERYRDPITLSLMDEPMVLSSGHHFDKSTLYDAHGVLRFDRCPMTRKEVSQDAYPLLYLRRELCAASRDGLDGREPVAAPL